MTLRVIERSGVAGVTHRAVAAALFEPEAPPAERFREVLEHLLRR